MVGAEGLGMQLAKRSSLRKARGAGPQAGNHPAPDVAGGTDFKWSTKEAAQGAQLRGSRKERERRPGRDDDDGKIAAALAMLA